MRGRVCLYVVLMIWGARAAHGQARPQVVQARMLPATNAAHAGSTLRVAIEAQISPGYHINDHHPSLEYLIPTDVSFEASKQMSLERASYPKGEAKKFAFADQPLSVYQGALLMGARVKIAPGVPAGDYTLKGKMNYQACNEQACLPPASVPLALTVKVVDRGVPLKRINADVFNRITID